MERITKNVRDLTCDERRVYEEAVGHALAEDQQVIIHVIDGDRPDKNASEPKEVRQVGGKSLPSWCNVYQGLTDDEIAEVERIALQRSDSFD